MTEEKITELQSGFHTAFIDSTYNSNLAYRPQFVYNDNKNGQKVFSSIEDELLRSDSFAISVAFITKGGITPLLQSLKELERRGVPGRSLTTDYLSFSDPVVLDTIVREFVMPNTDKTAVEIEWLLDVPVREDLYEYIVNEKETYMKIIRVVAAVIKAVNESGEPIIFATQRGYGDFKGGWEFPGGKIEEGDAPQEALIREIKEELETEISVGELIDTIEYDYPAFHLSIEDILVVDGDIVRFMGTYIKLPV